MTDPHPGSRHRRKGNPISRHGTKLHRRTVVLDGRPHTVLGLRPSATERFAVNLFHDTWHIVTHPAGAKLLSALLWHMSSTRDPHTLVVVDRPFLDTNPFDAAPSPPIVLAPADRTPFGDRAARDLRRQLPLSAASEGPVRLQLPGFTEALADTAEWLKRQKLVYDGYDERHRRPAIRTRSGVLVLPARADRLREWAVQIGSISPHGPDSYGYDFVNTDYSLEVQVFADYRDRVTAARLARAEVLAEGAPDDPVELHPLVWSRGTGIRRRMTRNRAVTGARGQARGRVA